ncbi:MAG: hypothetical protein AAF628_37625 [Planctomycetota bacterium]
MLAAATGTVFSAKVRKPQRQAASIRAQRPAAMVGVARSRLSTLQKHLLLNGLVFIAYTSLIPPLRHWRSRCLVFWSWEMLALELTCLVALVALVGLGEACGRRWRRRGHGRVGTPPA